MNEVPLFNHEMEWLGSFRKRNLEMRKKLEDMGVKKDFMLANNEFGLNWNWRSYPGFNRYTLSLINLEQGLEMFKSGMDSMALWNSLGWGFMGKTMLMDHQYGNRMNPVYFGLEMLWQSVGWEMLEMTTPEKRLHGFCATNRKMGEYTCKQLLLLLYFIWGFYDPFPRVLFLTPLLLLSSAIAFGAVLWLPLKEGNSSRETELQETQVKYS